MSTVLPRACSGAMYAAVPRTTPICVIAGVVMVGDCDDRGEIVAAGSMAPLELYGDGYGESGNTEGLWYSLNG